MKKVIDKLNDMSYNRIMTKLKHLRGKHDQLDHAWNRGMGQGGYGAGLASNQMGPLPTIDFYRKRNAELIEQRRRGEITRDEMRRQMRELRGITAAPANTENVGNESDSLVLGNKKKYPFMKSLLSLTPEELYDWLKTEVPPGMKNKGKKVYDLRNDIKQKSQEAVKIFSLAGTTDTSKLSPSDKSRVNTLYNEVADLNGNQLWNLWAQNWGQNGNWIMQFLKKLKQSNPQKISVRFKDILPGSGSDYTVKQKTEMTDLIQTVFALCPDTGIPADVTISVSLDGNSGYDPSKRELLLGFNSKNGKPPEKGKVDINYQILLHEAMHVMQFQTGYGVSATDQYGDAKFAGAPYVLIRDYLLHNDQSPIKVTLDVLENPYSTAMYPSHYLTNLPKLGVPVQNVPKYAELMSTLMDHISEIDEWQDVDYWTSMLRILLNGGK